MTAVPLTTATQTVGYTGKGTHAVSLRANNPQAIGSIGTSMLERHTSLTPPLAAALLYAPSI